MGKLAARKEIIELRARLGSAIPYLDIEAA
jgi:hypothetical protein